MVSWNPFISENTSIETAEKMGVEVDITARAKRLENMGVEVSVTRADISIIERENILEIPSWNLDSWALQPKDDSQ